MAVILKANPKNPAPPGCAKHSTAQPAHFVVVRDRPLTRTGFRRIQRIQRGRPGFYRVAALRPE